MRRISLLAVLGMLVVASTAFAAPAATWATGKISRFDAAAKTIVVKQGTHDMTFVLAPTVQLVQGKKTVLPTDMTAGRTVKIRYTTSGTTKTADRVEVSDPAPAPAPPKKIK